MSNDGEAVGTIAAPCPPDSAWVADDPAAPSGAHAASATIKASATTMRRRPVLGGIQCAPALRAERCIALHGAPALCAVPSARGGESFRLVLSFGGVAELADATAELAADLRQLPRAEEDQDDKQDQDEVAGLKRSHHFMVKHPPWVPGPSDGRA